MYLGGLEAAGIYDVAESRGGVPARAVVITHVAI